ncbi:hypothetical protein [Streptomyces sp. NPDC090798]
MRTSLLSLAELAASEGVSDLPGVLGFCFRISYPDHSAKSMPN